MSSAIPLDRPTLIVAGGNDPLEDRIWLNLKSWQDHLAALLEQNRLRGVILPLELATPSHCRGELYGLELLERLRWSTDSATEIPVVALAWQSLERILRSRPNLLLIHEFTCFQRLPVTSINYAPFCSAENHPFPRVGAPWSSIAARIDLDSANRTHHDLANDYYAAHRLWQGYRYLLQAKAKGPPNSADSLQELLKAADSADFEWLPHLQSIMKAPDFRRFQAASRRLEFPSYPPIPVEQADPLLKAHLCDGLPETIRILMVDDCFKKGLADVICKILFPTGHFTRTIEHEWVYSQNAAKGNWARFVCVDSVGRARNWLRHWSLLPEPKTSEEEEEFSSWIAEWKPRPPGQSSGPDAGATLQTPLWELDAKSAEPSGVGTIVLLDLRLEEHGHQRSYQVETFASVRFRELLAKFCPTIPVLMFTASRQALNYAYVMGRASEFDGWLIKEAPDIPVDDVNSSNAVLYLLREIHLLPNIKSWYREQMEWTFERKLQYSHWRNRPNFSDLLKSAMDLARLVFLDLRRRPFSDTKATSHSEFLKDTVPAGWDVFQRLHFSRLLVAAGLLLTADLRHSKLAPNVKSLQDFMPFKPKGQSTRMLKVYELLNFTADLRMRTGSFLEQLMECEIEWLRDLPWPGDRQKEIQTALITRQDF
jgi:hypothetical protein